LRECEEETAKICAVYQKRRDALVKGLARAGWAVEPPRGSMFVWARIPEGPAGKPGPGGHPGKNARPTGWQDLGSLEFSKLLLEKALVAVSPGVGFGPLGEGHVRFALVENEQRIRQAVRGIGRFLKGGM
jgi:alanine-synthesizing transaminase